MKKVYYYLKLLKIKDYYTYEHSLRVSYYSNMVGISLGLSNWHLQKLKKASLLHDIGKLLIPDNILNKKESLTPEEFDIIKNHTKYAKQILGENYNDIIDDILCHHERLDGSGYPFQTKNISLNAQIISIVDSFDAMTSNRGYNKVLSYEEAFRELYECSKMGKYNLNLVKIFYTNFSEQLNLNNKKAKQY